MKALKANAFQSFCVLFMLLLLAAALVAVSGCGAQQDPASGGSIAQGAASSSVAQSQAGSATSGGDAAAGGNASSSAVGGDAAASGEATQGAAGTPTDEQYNAVLMPTGMACAFIGEKFYDQKIADENDALAAVKSVFGRIGADDSTELVINAVRPTETGTTYYIFNQKAGDVLVFGASVKVIVDEEGMAVGLVSAILPEVQMPKLEDWEVTASQAEEIVKGECKETWRVDAKLVEGATEMVLIHIPTWKENFEYAWVVYTPNYEADSEMGYLAHYVDARGLYLYALPISEPHNADAAQGDRANFDFGKFEQSTWSGAVTLHDGSTKDIQVPVLVDAGNNASILADGTRKILCADYADWNFQETLSPRVSADASFDNMELLAYDAFIKVWDFFDSIGWTGPDGEETPTLLLMNYVNDNGDPEENAFYLGRMNGFQAFTFNGISPDGESMDIIAHEFAHAVSSTAMTSNVYLNDTASINEGMSDVLGNLVEMLVEGDPESAWLMGDGVGEGKTVRSIKDPHAHLNPEFRWDAYYAPPVAMGTATNDFGGAHANSTILGLISYRLDQAGMQPADQFYFWMNVELAMTPRTDYAQMAQLLPWCMEQAGYPQYVGALQAAIDAARLTALEEPATPPAGTGRVSIAYKAPGITDEGWVRFALIPAGTAKEIYTFPSAETGRADCAVPPGDYACTALIGANNPAYCDEYIYADGIWGPKISDTEAVFDVRVEEGKTVELSVQGLPESADAQA